MNYEKKKQLKGKEFNESKLEEKMRCKFCSRNFFKSRIRKHERVCIQRKKEEKKLTSSLEGREIVAHKDNLLLLKEKLEKKRKNSLDELIVMNNTVQSRPNTTETTNWKEKREEFQNLLHNAKEAMRILKRGGDLRDIPFKYSSHPDYVSCRYCARKFAPSKNQATLDNIQRHQDICENLSRRPRPPPNIVSPQMSSYDSETIQKYEKRRELHRKYSYSRASSPSSRMSKEQDYESNKLVHRQGGSSPMSSTQFKRFIEEKRNSIYNSVKSTHWDSKDDGQNEYPTVDSLRTQSYRSQPLTATNIQKLLMRKYSQVISQSRLADRHQLVASVLCHHCGRTFEKRAAQRHIPICSKVQQTPKSKRIFYRGKWVQVEESESLPAVQKNKQNKPSELNQKNSKRSRIHLDQPHKLNSIPESNNEREVVYLHTESAKRQGTANKKNRFMSTQKASQRLFSTGLQQEKKKNRVKADTNKRDTFLVQNQRQPVEKQNSKLRKNKYVESESERTHLKIKHELYHQRNREEWSDLGTRLVSFCTHCGAEFGNEDNFCGLCGKKRILK